MSGDAQPQASPDIPADDGGESDGPPTISSGDLLKGRREVWIDHDGQLYRLRVTSRGKLYLTK